MTPYLAAAPVLNPLMSRCDLVRAKKNSCILAASAKVLRCSKDEVPGKAEAMVKELQERNAKLKELMR